MERTRAYGKYLSALLLFGLNGIVASHIQLSSYEIVFTRSLIASVFLALIFIITQKRFRFPENKRHFFYLALSGVAMGTSWMFLYEAYRQIGVGVATLANYCGPVIVMVVSPLFFREKITLPKIAGFLTVMVGMVCINYGAMTEGKSVWGVFCGIMSAVTYAGMIISNKKASSITGLENAMWQLISAFVTVGIFLGFKQGLVLRIGRESLLPVLILGVVNTGIGCYFYFSSIGWLPVQSVAICGYLEPLAAVVFSALLLHEAMDAVQILGVLLIFGGAAFGELYHRRGAVPTKQSSTSEV